MADQDNDVPIGPVLDELGVTIPMSPQDRLTEVLVIGKVTNLDTGQVALAITSNDLDWIARWGLHTAAAEVFTSRPFLRCTDEDDD